MSDDGSLVLIGAHADDIELHAGGLAASAAEQGRAVHFVMTTNNMSGNLLNQPGTSGPVRLPPAQTQAIRVAEQRAAAEVVGAELHLLDYPQRHYWDGQQPISLSFHPIEHDQAVTASPLPPLIIAAQDDQAIDRMAALLVKLQPSTIVTHTVTDFDPEHHATASLVYQAFRRRRSDLAGATLLFWAPGTTSQGGMIRQSFDCVVPFGQSQFDQKMRMLRCHASQMTPRRLEMSERRARAWGAEIEAPFAEPFTTVVNPAMNRLSLEPATDRS